MLTPSCSRCGCALDALTAPGTASLLEDPPTLVRGGRALRLLGMAALALIMYAGTRVGVHEAGAAGGMIAFGTGGLLMLPFVPERWGARRPGARQP